MFGNLFGKMDDSPKPRHPGLASPLQLRIGAAIRLDSILSKVLGAGGRVLELPEPGRILSVESQGVVDLGEGVRLLGKNSSGNFGLVDSGGQIIADSMSMSIVRPGIKAPPEVIKMLSVAAGRAAGNFSSEVFFHGRVYLASVSAVSGSRWWIYEIMDSADIPARKTSFWAKRVVFSGVLLIIIFGFITHRLALLWLKN